MKMFWKKEEIQEKKYSLKVGHDRNGILIVKELSIKSNTIEELMELTQEALEEFDEMKLRIEIGKMEVKA
tara:strand:- start:5736 stop:5945 length:210 start_codon:yes stop_codon:yes gene_type:complete